MGARRAGEGSGAKVGPVSQAKPRGTAFLIAPVRVFGLVLSLFLCISFSLPAPGVGHAAFGTHKLCAQDRHPVQENNFRGDRWLESRVGIRAIGRQRWHSPVCVVAMRRGTRAIDIPLEFGCTQRGTPTPGVGA
jgi:hypothetical protein